MEIISAEPKVVKSYWLPMQEARIMPLGDIQYGAGFGAEGSDVPRLKRYLSWGAEHDVRFVGMGDYVDVASPSNRRAMSELRGRLYDSVRRAIDEKVGQQVDELKDILRPSVGKWFGLLRGHHYWEFEDGTTTDSRLAEYLKCPLLGDCAVLILTFRRRSGGGIKRLQAKIWLHHGPSSGAAQLETAPLTRLEHVTKKFFANVYLVGHYHKKGVTVMPWIDFAENRGAVRMVGTNRYLVSTGAFLRGYQHGSKGPDGRPAGGYAEKAMLGPTALGAPLVMLRPVFTHDHTGDRIDVNVQV